MVSPKYEQLLLSEIKRLSDAIDKLSETTQDYREDHHKLAKEVTAVKIKSGIWGSVSGALTAIGITLTRSFHGH